MSQARVIQLGDRYAVRFPDPAGAMRTPTANGRSYPVERTLRVSDYKPAAETVCGYVNRLIDRKRTGDPMAVATAEWVNTMPLDWRNKLTAWGLLDPASTAGAASLDQHVKDFEASIGANPKSANRAPEVARRVRTLAKAAKIERLGDITPGRVEAGLSQMTKDGRASNTLLVHRQAMLAFAKWCAREKRLAAFPLSGLSAVSASTERVRRALDFNEQRWLLTVTGTLPDRVYRDEVGRVVTRISGAERALVYELVLGTGLRSKELRGLRAGAFSLSATKPTLQLPAANEKAKRGHTFTVPAGVVQRLRDHLARKAPGALAFALPRSDAMADMVRDDLATARDRWIKADGIDPAERTKRERSDFLAEKDSEGAVFDFHALRATFVTNLARSGVSLFHAAKLARHRDPQLTAGTYAKLGITDELEALAKLPSLTADPDPAALRATGTNGEPIGTQAIRTSRSSGPEVSA